MKQLDIQKRARARRKGHIRKNVIGTTDRPRATIFRSNRYLYLQLIDDTKGHTLVQASTREKEFNNMGPNVVTGEKLGKLFGERIKQVNISSIVFDRNGYRYHGVIKSLADGIRSIGVEF